MNRVRDGELYKHIELYGKAFDIYYGYYEEYEKESEFAEPIPIYPDFENNPVYTNDGYPFVTHMQALCEYGDSRFVDGCCFDCHYFSGEEDLIGVCRCSKRRNTKENT